MASLACIMKDLGEEVQGSDLSKHFFTEDPLVARNIPIFNFDPSNIKDNMLVIIGNAFHDDFPEVAAALNNPTVTCFHYHQYVGELMKKYQSFSVAGSHGKTTTSTLLSAMFNYDSPCGYLIGDGTGKVPLDAKRFVVESCEFRRHFLSYYPDYAIITNVEIDHVDYFKSVEDYHSAYEEFAKNVKNKIVMFGDDVDVRNLKIASEKAFFYGFNDNNDIYAYNVIQNVADVEFDVMAKGEKFGHYHLPIVGDHMIADALACIAIGYLCDLPSSSIQAGLANFKGAKRRYVIEEAGPNVFIDDYAHHPTEVNVTIKATRVRYPNHKIVAIFKPHRASRLVTFVNEFTEALMLADYSGVCEFTSIDDFDDGTKTSVSYLTDRVPNCKIFTETDSDADYLASLAPAVYLFMSSKDIYDFADMVKQRLR